MPILPIVSCRFSNGFGASLGCPIRCILPIRIGPSPAAAGMERKTERHQRGKKSNDDTQHFLPPKQPLLIPIGFLALFYKLEPKGSKVVQIDCCESPKSGRHCICRREVRAYSVIAFAGTFVSDLFLLLIWH
jgi:hypothetical protein